MIGCLSALEAMFAIALWLISVPDPAPQPTQRLIGLEGKVSAKDSPLIKVNKAIDNKMTKSTLFIKNSFLFDLHSVFQFTKKVYSVKLIPEFGNSLNLFKHIFRSAAYGADPTVREFMKGCVGGDIPIGIALFRIVNITTDITFPFFHLCLQSEFTPSPTLSPREAVS
jgi:hypothetical protein